MNKKFVAIICCIILIVSVVIISIKGSSSDKKQDELYVKIESMILNEEDKENLDTFISMKRLGYKEEEENTYIYCWIQVEKFFLNEEGIVELDSGSSMPYKFTFKENEIVGYEVPGDGSKYESSIKEIFPLNVRRKFSGIYKDDKLKNGILTQVEDFYQINRSEIY